MKSVRFPGQVIRPSCIVIVFCLIVSSAGGASASSAPISPGSQTGQNAFLEELAKDTWYYLKSDWATDNHLPWSWRSRQENGGSYANVTEIGFYALSWLAAYDLQRSWSPTWAKTEAEVTAVLDQLLAWQTEPNSPNAFDQSAFYQWYWVSETPPVVGPGAGDHVVPSIDNAFLAASLITIREYAEAKDHPGLVLRANDILNRMYLNMWYQYDTHRFSLGATESPLGGGPADYFSNENRIINLVAYALGHLTAEEFQLSLDALEKPTGSYSGIAVERMAWDGSYFTYPGPALFIREMETLYGLHTIIPATYAQILYAKKRNYAAWGLSDTYDRGLNDNVQQGAPPAARPVLTGNDDACPTGAVPFMYECVPGLVTPHASALALITPLAPQAIANLQKMSTTFDCYDPLYGFQNAVKTKPGAGYGTCTGRFYTLEQEWMFLAIANYENGFIWKYFYRDSRVADAHAKMYHQLASPKSGGAQDGWALETSENSNQGGLVNATAPTFVLGDDSARRQYRAVLSFNTASLPDNAVITRVILKIRKQSVTGIDPFTTHGKIVVDIRKGAFSNSTALQPMDFQAAANKLNVGAFVNKPQPGGWYSVDLIANAFSFVHRAGITQLRLRFQKDDDNDAVADLLRFFSGNAPAASRPVLLIEYYVP